MAEKPIPEKPNENRLFMPSSSLADHEIPSSSTKTNQSVSSSSSSPWQSSPTGIII